MVVFPSALFMYTPVVFVVDGVPSGLHCHVNTLVVPVSLSLHTLLKDPTTYLIKSTSSPVWILVSLLGFSRPV